MTDYKLVPVEPTPEMVEAGGAVYWKNIEDVFEIYRAMLAAAPAVQGEPVAVMYEDGSLLSKADCGDNFEICCKVQTPLYAAPQPAEQQPDVAWLVEALENIAKLPIDPCSTENDYRLSGAKAIANAALSAYREGGAA